MTDAKGQPVAGVKVVVTSSEHLYLYPDETSDACDHLEGLTDKHGKFSVRHTLTSQPNFFESLFGAPAFHEQYIAFKYTDAEGKEIVSKIYMRPDGTDWRTWREIFYFDSYKNEGPFVELPATFGNTCGFVSGLLPAVVIGTPLSFIGAEKVSNITLSGLLFITTKSVGAVIGVPFYAVKKLLWDWPHAILGLREEKDSQPPIDSK